MNNLHKKCTFSEDYPKVLFVFKACAFSYLILIVSSRPQTHFKIQALINLINYINTSLKKRIWTTPKLLLRQLRRIEFLHFFKEKSPKMGSGDL